MAEPRERVVNPLKITAAVIAALGSTAVGSVAGDGGTRAGIVLGTVASCLIAAWVEHGGARAVALARGIQPPAMSYRVNGRIALVVAAVTAVGLIAVVAIAEASTGKTLHGIVTHSADYGSTFTSGNSSHSHVPSVLPTVTRSPAPSPSSPASFSPEPTLMPTVTVTPSGTFPATTPPSSALPVPTTTSS